MGPSLAGRWKGDRFAWLWDEATPVAFEAAMAALPDALEYTVVTDGAAQAPGLAATLEGTAGQLAELAA